MTTFLERFAAEPGQAGDNARRWRRHPANPILSPLPGTWMSDWVSDGSILQVGDEFRMYIDGKAGPVERIGLARCPAAEFDGLRWDLYPGSPILDIGPGGYDHVSVFDPCVLQHDGRFWMYYTGVGGPPDRVCLATSDDGLRWEKHERNPLLNGRCPHAVYRDGTTYLFYQVCNEDGGNNIYLATAADGVNFTRYPVRPIVPRSAEGEWDWFSLATVRVFEDEGVYHMLYGGDAERVDEPRGFGVLTSTDLIRWERFAGNPIFRVGEPGAWDSEAIWCPWVMRRGEEYWMWYCGSRTSYSEGLTPQVGLAII